MDKQEEQQFTTLLKGYLEESLGPAELEDFFEMAGRPENILLLEQAFEKDLQLDPVDVTSPGQAAHAWSTLNTKLKPTRATIPAGRIFIRWIAAAVFLIGVLYTVYLLKKKNRTEDIAKVKHGIVLPPWLKPEHIGATLFLANGDSVMLDGQSKEVVATQGNMQISQSNGSISYSGNDGEQQFNEVKTAPGKLFRCILPDQSVVWLNGGSSIRYPLAFNADRRSVEVTGEVYFEVMHHPEMSFRVACGGQVIEDIGTTFNLDASASGLIVTTLAEGAVSVQFNNKKLILKPDEQSTVSKGAGEISLAKKVNLDQVLAWKNGLFYFQKASLYTVMKQISTWYGVKVVYQNSDTSQQFSGQIDQSLSLEQVLQGLEQPGVHFNLKDSHQIIVSRK